MSRAMHCKPVKLHQIQPDDNHRKTDECLSDKSNPIKGSLIIHCSSSALIKLTSAWLSVSDVLSMTVCCLLLHLHRPPTCGGVCRCAVVSLSVCVCVLWNVSWTALTFK